MRRLIWSTAAALLLFAVHPAQAQNTLGGKVVTTCGTPGAFPTNGRPGPFTVDVNGKLCTDAAGGGGGDATAANQALQITQETAINTILGTVAVSPTANTIADRLKVINTTLGSPFQAGGSIGNTTFAVTNAGTFAVQAAQATAANLNATVVGTGTFATQASIADGANVAQGAIADTAYAGSGNATVVAALKGIYASVNGAIPAGTAIIGKVGIDQTTDGTTNAVRLLAETTKVIGTVNSPINTTPTNCSGTVTAGGTAQNAFAAGATKHGFMIQNLSTDMMWISFTGAATDGAAGSYALNPATVTTAGGSFSSPPGFGMNTALSVLAATTDDAFSCTWW